jgi:hypothetical protein
MPSAIDIWALKADYVHPTKKGKFEAGVKSSYVQSDNNLRTTTGRMPSGCG